LIQTRTHSFEKPGPGYLLPRFTPLLDFYGNYQFSADGAVLCTIDYLDYGVVSSFKFLGVVTNNNKIIPDPAAAYSGASVRAINHYDRGIDYFAGAYRGVVGTNISQQEY
jgi:hypothetical protein